MSIKNPAPPLTPAPVPTSNDALFHPPTDSAPTHTQTSTSDSPGIVSLTQAQRDQYPTDERDPEEPEQITEKLPTEWGPLTDEAVSATEEQSQLVLIVGSDASDFFPAPQNPESGPGSGGRAGITDEPTDVSPPLKPVGELPIDTSKVETPKGIERTVAIEDDGDSTQPKDLVTHTTQALDTRVSLPAFTTQPFLSVSEVTEQDDSTYQPSEEGAVDAHGEPNSVNGYVVGEIDPKIQHVEDVKDKAESALLPSTPTTPGAEEGSLAAEDQPHPAERVKKQPDTEAVSFVSVRDFCCV